MTNLKKTLVATALLSAVGVAQAAEFTTAPKAVANELVQLSVTAGNITFKPKDSEVSLYATGAKLVFTFTGGAKFASVPNQLTVNGVNLTRGATTESTVTYELAGNWPTTAGVADTLTVSGLQFLTSSTQGANTTSVGITVLNNAGVAILTGKPATGAVSDVLVPGSAYETSVTTKIAREINLATSKVFTNTGATTSFSLAFAQANRVFKTSGNANIAGGDTFAPARGETNYVLAGDFSWLKDTNAATSGIQLADGTISFPANCSGTTYAADRIEFTCTDAVTAGTINFSILQGEASASPLPLNTTSFKLSATQKFQNAGVTASVVTANGLDAGSFTNNGTVSNVYYMPYGTDISQIIYVTNTTGLEAIIRVTAVDEKGVTVLDNVEVGSTTSQGITELSGVIKTKLTDKLGKAPTGKYKLTTRVNAPGAQFFYAYNVAGDRLATK